MSYSDIIFCILNYFKKEAHIEIDRFESLCYGPKSCKLYKMGKPRAVPYKDCGSDYDEGWMDDLCTERRGLDD